MVGSLVAIFSLLETVWRLLDSVDFADLKVNALAIDGWASLHAAVFGSQYLCIRFTNVGLIAQEVCARVCGIFDERPRSFAHDMDEGIQRILTTHMSPKRTTRHLAWTSRSTRR